MPRADRAPNRPTPPRKLTTTHLRPVAGRVPWASVGRRGKTGLCLFCRRPPTCLSLHSRPQPAHCACTGCSVHGARRRFSPSLFSFSAALHKKLENLGHCAGENVKKQKGEIIQSVEKEEGEMEKPTAEKWCGQNKFNKSCACQVGPTSPNSR